jgi:ubiquinol-cytochrome c reductase cytochrome c1 subunit
MKLLKKLIAALALVPVIALAAESEFPLDRAPERTTDLPALQNGARLFVNYCLNCHAASAMRYNRLRDIGLTDEQIENNLLFTSDKVGDLMKIAMPAKDARDWFGAVPPDLSVIARAKASGAGSGADWLYTYMRTFYKDDNRPTGWNNMVFPNVGMPHVLWELQGVRTAKFVDEKDPHDPSKTVHKFAGFEPAQNTRKRLGVWVLLFLGVFAFIAWRLNASYWKDIK